MNKFSIPNTYNFIYRTYSRTGEGLSPSWASRPSSINFSALDFDEERLAQMQKTVPA